MLLREKRRLTANLSQSRANNLSGTLCIMCGGRITRSGWPVTKQVQSLLCSRDDIRTAVNSPNWILAIALCSKSPRVLGASFSGGHRTRLFVLGNTDNQKIGPTSCTETIKRFLQLVLANFAPCASSVKQEPWQKQESLPCSPVDDHRCVPTPRGFSRTTLPWRCGMAPSDFMTFARLQKITLRSQSSTNLNASRTPCGMTLNSSTSTNSSNSRTSCHH